MLKKIGNLFKALTIVGSIMFLSFITPQVHNQYLRYEVGTSVVQVLYLETFAHTVAVMQRREDIVRVSRECAVDLARDGVVYAEVRMAPELLTEKGLTLSQVIEAIL